MEGGEARNSKPLVSSFPSFFFFQVPYVVVAWSYLFLLWQRDDVGSSFTSWGRELGRLPRILSLVKLLTLPDVAFFFVWATCVIRQ